jgi:membrane protein DedA with SNARE-associated domain
MTTFLTNEGYLALVIFAFIQACCIPISSEITFGFAGVLAYQHHLSLALVIIIGSLAELAGSSTAYAIGRKGGRNAVERFRRYVLMTRKDVDRAERFFAGRGAWSVAVARVIPLVRAFTGLVAGLVEVPAAPFAIFNLIGTVVWASALSIIGYELGGDWTKASKNFSHASDALAVVVILALVVIIAHKWLQVRKERKDDMTAAASGAAATSRPDAPAATSRPDATTAAPDPEGQAASAPGGPAAPPARASTGRHRAPTDSKGG